MQADEVAEVGVDADVGQPDLGGEAHGAVGGAEVSVLVHLEGHLKPDFGGVAAEFADRDRPQAPDVRVVGVAHPLRGPEPQRLLLGFAQRAEQTEADRPGADRDGGVDQPVRRRGIRRRGGSMTLRRDVEMAGIVSPNEATVSVNSFSRAGERSATRSQQSVDRAR